MRYSGERYTAKLGITGDDQAPRAALEVQGWRAHLPAQGTQVRPLTWEDHGPLGVPTHTEGLKKVAVVGGGVGCAIAYPVAKKLHESGCEVHSIIGFRNKDLVILEDEFKAVSDKCFLMTDDGSAGEKGVVTAPLAKLIEDGETYDEVIAIGPLVMMKFVVATTRPHNIKTMVSMNPIMIDGTGMCGGCRLTVGGKTKFACVDGPDFDGFEVDFDEAISRSRSYPEFEARAREKACKLFKKEEN